MLEIINDPRFSAVMGYCAYEVVRVRPYLTNMSNHRICRDPWTYGFLTIASIGIVLYLCHMVMPIEALNAFGIGFSFPAGYKALTSGQNDSNDPFGSDDVIDFKTEVASKRETFFERINKFLTR